MKVNSVLKIILLVTLYFGVHKIYAQNYADKDYYLVDSLVIDDLAESDKMLLDSCLKNYHKAEYDTTRLFYLGILCDNMMHQSWEKYQQFQYEIITTALGNPLSEKSKKLIKNHLAVALNNFGYLENDRGNVKKALKYYQESLQISEEVESGKNISTALNNIGNLYNDQGDIENALVYLHRGLKIDEEENNKNGMSYVLNNIGKIYTEQGDLKLAKSYYKRALEIGKELNSKDIEAISLNNLGYIFIKENKVELALENFNRSLLIEEEIGDIQGVSSSLSSIGSIYVSLGDDVKALEYYSKSLDIREKMGYVLGIASSLNDIGNIYYKNDNLKLAKKFALRSMKLSKELNYPRSISESAELLSKIYEKESKGLKALEMHKLYIEMRDSITSEKNAKIIAMQEAKHQYEKQKAIDDKESEKLIAIEKEAKEKQEIMTYTTFGGLGLVIVFSFFIFQRLQITKKNKSIIEQQKLVVEEAHKEITDSINYAKRIQNAILPASGVIKEYLSESFVLYKPKDVVAGDFYWLEAPVHLPKEEEFVLFAAADCTGHGVPGAMVSVVCHNAMNRAVREFGLTEPGKILDKTREIVVSEFEKSEDDVKDGMDIALCSLSGNILQYAGAHNPLWIVRNNEILETKANKQPIGKFDNPVPYKTHSVELQKEDSIYIFSDGYVDQFGGEKDKKFGSKRFKELLISVQDKSMEEQKNILNSTFENWMKISREEQLDDVCVIGVKV